MKVVVVCGDWNVDEGRPSKLMAAFVEGLSTTPEVTGMYFNGGPFYKLYKVVENYAKDADAIIWAPNIDNSLGKVRDIKIVNPHCVLVSSKANLKHKYSVKEVVARALAMHSQLVLHFTVNDVGRVAGQIIDTLANAWSPPMANFYELGQCVGEQIRRLSEFKRVPSISIGAEAGKAPVPPEFLETIVRFGGVFHRLMDPPADVVRFLGNSSFRCTRGFPSMRMDDYSAYVSRRNVDKQSLTAEDFIYATIDAYGRIRYSGVHKPSVDTPIQLALYANLPKINFMIHSHTYVAGAPYTKRMCPCGALEEVEEVLAVIEEYDFDTLQTGFAVNLVGHGSIMFASKVSDFGQFAHDARPMPEHMYEEELSLDELLNDTFPSALPRTFSVHLNTGEEVLISGANFDAALENNDLNLMDVDWYNEV